MKDKQYALRNVMELDEAGGYYCRHVYAMTGEQLHSKGDIASELGHRDMLIDQLTARAEAAEAELKRRDVQEPVAWAHRLVNKHSGVVHPWVYGSSEKETSEGDIFCVEVIPLYTAAPAAVLPQDPVTQAVSDAVAERTAAVRIVLDEESCKLVGDSIANPDQPNARIVRAAGRASALKGNKTK